MKCVILTGMSGSGKSTALKMIEDMGYFCVGNLPISLVESVVQLAENDPELDRIAINVDVSTKRASSCFFWSARTRLLSSVTRRHAAAILWRRGSGWTRASRRSARWWSR